MRYAARASAHAKGSRLHGRRHLTLALGIGANTATFGVIDSVLIRPLAYPNAEALVGVWHTAPGLPGLPSLGLSPSMYFTYRDENQTFEQFGLWSSAGASITGVAEPEMPRALFVTYGVLDAVGVKPLLGRWFSLAPLVFRIADRPRDDVSSLERFGLSIHWQFRGVIRSRNRPIGPITMSIGHSVDDPPPEPQTYVFFRDIPVGGFFLPLLQGCVCTWEKASWRLARLVKSDPGCASPIHSDPGVQRTFAGDDPVKPQTSQSGVWELR